MNSKRVYELAQEDCLTDRFSLSPLSLAIRSSIVGLGLAHGAHAATITVDSNLDDNGAGCTLREAIASANTSVDQDNGCAIGSDLGTDTITFSNSLVSANTITLDIGDLAIVDQDIEIIANMIDEGITVDGDNTDRVFYALASRFTLDSLIITGGLSSMSQGAGIYSQASELEINNSTISGNSAFAGGGIFLYSSTVNVNNSTISANRATFGGGLTISDNSSVYIDRSEISSNIAVYGGGANLFYAELSLANSTVSGNSALEDGGGLRGVGSNINLSKSLVFENSASGNGGGIFAAELAVVSAENNTISANFAQSGGGLYVGRSTVDLINSTISGNSAASVGGAIYAFEYSEVDVNQSTIANNDATLAGGVYARYGSISLRNSIIAGSTNVTDGFSSDDCREGPGGTITIDTATITEDGTCGALTFGDPGLLPLANNGGPTKTHALKPNSIARNKGPAVNCPSQDQRGQNRDVSDGFCDIGAYEFIEDMFYVIPLGNGKTVVVPL